MRKWFIVVTKDQHLVVPYIVTQDDCGSPKLFDSERDALEYKNDYFGNDAIIIEFEN